MTTHRNLDPYTFFADKALNHKPVHAFKGKTKTDFSRWKKQTLPKVIDSLGHRPDKVKPNAQLIIRWNEDGLIKERWIIDTQQGLSASLILFRPDNLKRGEKRPAILCCHGHSSGGHGKDPLMGLIPKEEYSQHVTSMNYDYGLQMAKKGFVTFAIDWLGFGERASKNKPHFHAQAIGDRDECNINYLCATLMGTTVLAINTHDGSAATDFVASQKYVDADNLGVMGLSLGGTMTTWMALTDPRFKAIDVLCYAGPFYDIAFQTYNVCGSQITPGLHDLIDTPELQGLIAPKPLLIELGMHDTCFHVDHAYGIHYKKLEKIYKAAKAQSQLELDLFPGGHAWGANKSETFFRNHLHAAW